MIVFGCPISETEPYERFAKRGLDRVREPGSELLAFAAVDTLARSLNILLEAAARRRDLEALVLVNPYAELTDAGLCAKVREAFSDPEVAVLGPLGARGVRSIAWWEGEAVSCASGFVYRWQEKGGGELPGLPWVDTVPAPAEVDVIDGMVMVLSPWAVENLRFDETFVGHGTDVDFCLRVREAGRRLRTIDVGVVEHRPLKIITDVELWTEAHVDFARKWADKMSGPLTELELRRAARRMEAERESDRSIAYFKKLSYDARVEPYERELEAAVGTLSWRLTLPLRLLNQRRHEAAATRASTNGGGTNRNWGR